MSEIDNEVVLSTISRGTNAAIAEIMGAVSVLPEKQRLHVAEVIGQRVSENTTFLERLTHYVGASK